MGLFDFLKRAPASTPQAQPDAAAAVAHPAPPVATRFPADRAAMFDLALTQRLSELFATPRISRDAAWADSFFAAAWNASLQVANPPTLRGPDGFIYVRLQIPQPATAFDSNSLSNFAAQCLENGHGIAIFASPEAREPEYVISMGVLDCLLRYDSWDGDPQDKQELPGTGATAEASGLQSVTMTRDTEVMIGSPSAFLLPAYTARALHRHIAERWHMREPRIALMVSAEFHPTRNFVIGRRLSEFPSDEVAGREMRLLLWFFPPHRGLLLLPNATTLDQMRLLTDFFPKSDEASS